MATTYTDNLNLQQPDLDDDALITVINNDMAIIDKAVNGVQDGLAIVANGNTHVAISAGQFVYVRNHTTLTEGLYVASSNIAANATLSTSNLTADSAGGLNVLNSKITQYEITATDISTLKTNIKNLLNSMQPGEFKNIRFTAGFTSDGFVTGYIYSGSVYCQTIVNSVCVYASGSVVGNNSDLITFSINFAIFEFDAISSKIENNIVLTTDKGWSNLINIKAYKYGRIVTVCGYIKLDAGTYTTSMPILVLSDVRPIANVYAFTNDGSVILATDNNSRTEVTFDGSKTVSESKYFYVNFTFQSKS